ncbi:hypothetical protein AGABI2DRAFT_210044 [Agaricus bisporus var. bisporus H97]|uniref:hypothetical protein n=1 Tax=Agaricus bisporus var. bisporus (strain H97 / ATCC MYA-4626 / FGSC 10389) TaxID=936046 RepID=UPI00029F4FEC|nr:hypothetical protein AGABI2DRAFT_210044 [Agaricus bisporus var. bisporus H97]EKV43386.1 hypothetical protein AGABI2DRAFT_210044 [Agaricus bisporus var. bisporus H97]
MSSERLYDMPERRLLILFATETGTAQDIADRIARESRNLLFKSQVVSVDCYTLENLVEEDFVIFVVSTTGSGVEPRAMTPMWNMLLSANLPPDLFEDLSFAVFGLGDTSYDKFCWPAKMLSKRLRSLGATEVCERGEGDEQHPFGIDGAFEPWLTKLSDTISDLYPLPNDIAVIPTPQIPESRVILKSSDSTGESKLPSSPGSLSATIISNRRMTAKGWNQDVRHIQIQLEKDVDYLPGDLAIIHPIASSQEVEDVLDSLGWTSIADEPLSIQRRLEDQSLPASLPETFTMRTLFSHHLDFNAMPRRTFFQYLRNFNSDETEREKLDEFLSKEGADELYEYCYKVKRTIREILSEFRKSSIPQNYVFDVFPFLRPRQFSIASSAKAHKRQVHLCAAIVKYKTQLKVPRKGVCTTYLSNLGPGSKLQVEIQRGLLKLPPSINTPVICVGPGTGIAPMRAIIEERLNLGSQSNTLYFGCRSATKDEHYADEWRRYSETCGLTYRVAHSRDGPEGVKRTYVQDLIEQDSYRIWKLLEDEKAWVYISGSSNKMPAGVRAALAKTLEKEGGYSEEDSKKYVEGMVREGRLIEECWS